MQLTTLLSTSLKIRLRSPIVRPKRSRSTVDFGLPNAKVCFGTFWTVCFSNDCQLVNHTVYGTGSASRAADAREIAAEVAYHALHRTYDISQSLSAKIRMILLTNHWEPQPFKPPSRPLFSWSCAQCLCCEYLYSLASASGCVSILARFFPSYVGNIDTDNGRWLFLMMHIFPVHS